MQQLHRENNMWKLKPLKKRLNKAAKIRRVERIARRKFNRENRDGN